MQCKNLTFVNIKEAGYEHLEYTYSPVHKWNQHSCNIRYCGVQGV